ncbi:MAG: hypothetical protein L6Q60_11120 [Rhodocyclaceae bacterium]|nr:hypothetical protein [Rhodocyclaceae bacterium]
MNNPPHLNLIANKSDEWRKIADETEKALSVASAIEHKNYPAGGSDSPPGLLPALVVAVSLARVRDACLAVADQGASTGEPMLIERLAGIEQELYGLAVSASDAFHWLTDPKRNGGGKHGGR